jgi:hypothetical protein
MVTSEVVTGAWQPKTESEKVLVRSQLEKIVSDSRFVTSKRYPKMLRYIVEQTLAENEDNLKERTLGVEVFDRKPDYDTNLDPVVRLCAGEVRKRIAQYYQSPSHAGELRIELNPGSYIPIFSLPVQLTSTLDVISVDVPSQRGPVSQYQDQIQVPGEQAYQPKKIRRAYWLTSLAALCAIVAAVSVLNSRNTKLIEKPKSVVDGVWSPLIASNKPILFCVGQSQLFAPHDSPLTELQKGADDDSFRQALADKNDFVPFSDVQILTKFVSLIGAYGHDFRVQDSRMTVSSQLREGPVVLIGALNNDWTLNRTSSLRFHLEGPDGPNKDYWIADTQHPQSRAWQVSALAPKSKVVKDYGIAARFTDEATGQIVLVAAGIAGSGTKAAGEFLTDEAGLEQLSRTSGVDWSKNNFEVILSAEVVNGMRGKPKVEAIAFW